MKDQSFQSVDLAFLGSLLPGIIHNMATPLSGVLGATQLLEKRITAVDELLKADHELAEATRTELEKQLEKNRTNIEILARNAKHLADQLQILVRRINRCGITTKEFYSINELLQSELQFLEANLTFKHKVKKMTALGADVAVDKFCYGHVAAALDEFVTETISLHNLERGVMEMDFMTIVEEKSVTLTVVGRITARGENIATSDILEDYLKRLKEDGWTVQHTCSLEQCELRLGVTRR